MIKEKTGTLRTFLQGLITKEMSAEELQRHQDMIKSLDDIDGEESGYLSEISKCKDQIVSLVNSQGTATPPKEEKKPRTLEEIASELQK